jgi:hypothetical protein
MRNVKYNETGALPQASREFDNARMQYLELAAKIKSAKQSLGLPPGIESELIIDAKELYDNAGTDTDGITHRLDTATQRADSKSGEKRAIIGGVVAGAGVIGGLAGNALINSKDESVRALAGDLKTAAVGKVSEKINGGVKNSGAAASAGTKTGTAGTAAKKPANYMSAKAREDLFERLGGTGYAEDAVVAIENNPAFQSLESDEQVDVGKILGKKGGKTVSEMTPEKLTAEIQAYKKDTGYAREGGKITDADTRKTIAGLLDPTSSSSYTESVVVMMEHNARFNALEDAHKIGFVKQWKKTAKAVNDLTQKDLTLAIIDYEKSQKK